MWVFMMSFPEKKEPYGGSKAICIAQDEHAHWNHGSQQDQDKHSRHMLSRVYRLFSFPDTTGPYIHHQDSS